MTENPSYTHTVTQTTTLKDVYGDWATVEKITPRGYIAIDFRPVKTNESYVSVFGPGVEVAVTSTSTTCRLIVKEAPKPIIFNPSLFGAEATKTYGTDNIMLNVGYCLYGFMPKLSVGRNDVFALSPTLKNMCPKVDILSDVYNLIWIYKES